MSFVCYNGTFLPIDQPGLTAGNRSYKWGEGVFETIKVYKDRILLPTLHFDRLQTSVELLQMRLTISLKEIEDKVLTLCAKNDCSNLGRVRLALFREEDNKVGYTIEATSLSQQTMRWNEQGVEIVTYPYARKACDVWANLKTANYLPYVMAARYAEDHGVSECLVLNCFNNICDASKANVFIIKDTTLFTPGLDQGCINGVMRRFLIQELKEKGWAVKQTALTEEMILQADECFLTNAIHGIRWVSTYQAKQYSSNLTKQLFETLQPVYLS